MASSPVSAAANLAAELVALERSAAVASAHLCQHRAELADRTKPFVQRYADDDVEPLTWFHSREAPDSALIAVFASMAKRIRTFDAATGRAAVVLMRRYSDHTGLAITTFMVHRLFLAAMLVAAKAHHDQVVRNRDFAKIFSLQLAELNRLECAFCIGIDWCAQVSIDDLSLPPASPTPLLRLVDEWPLAGDSAPGAHSFGGGQLSSTSTTRRYFDRTRGSLSGSTVDRRPGEPHPAANDDEQPSVPT